MRGEGELQTRNNWAGEPSGTFGVTNSKQQRLSLAINRTRAMEATKLNEVQKSLLRMFDRGMSEEETLEVKRLLTRYYAQKAREEATRVAEQKGYTQADYDAVLNHQGPRR